MDWHNIIERDPFLAGSIAAREWSWWQDKPFVEAQMPQKFIEGWNFELEEQKKVRQEERDAKGIEQG